MTTNRAVTNSTGSADPAAVGQDPPPWALPSAHLLLPPCGRHSPADTHTVKSPSIPCHTQLWFLMSLCHVSCLGAVPDEMDAAHCGCCPLWMLPTADAAHRGCCPPQMLPAVAAACHHARSLVSLAIMMAGKLCGILPSPGRIPLPHAAWQTD